MKNILLNRDDFKTLVLKRDNHKCVLCDVTENLAVHHIIDRSLFENGGYFIDNGVSLCEAHHIDAETTVLSCEELREKAGIKNIIYPDYIGISEFVISYDKWLNPIYKSGKRGKGYIFHQENVQKILKQGNVLHLFEDDFNRIVDKYPRSYHFGFSKGTTSDDRISKNVNNVLSGENVLTCKLDGSNTAFSEMGLFGRSRTESTQNPWDKYLYPKWESIKSDLKAFDIEICGESMFGEHSLIYSKLEHYFYVFGIKNVKHDMWLSWDETEYYSELFDFPTVPVIMKTNKDWNISYNDFQNLIENDIMTKPSLFSDETLFTTPKEGCVCRVAREFPNDMFFNSLFKYVREKHVKTNEHWTKNWKRARLHHEIKDLSKEQLKEIYKTQIEEGLINI